MVVIRAHNLYAVDYSITPLRLQFPELNGVLSSRFRHSLLNLATIKLCGLRSRQGVALPPSDRLPTMWTLAITLREQLHEGQFIMAV